MSLPNKQSYNSLGGELADYSPVTDPTTDLSAEASNEMRSDVSAMTRTAVRAWVSFEIAGSSCVVSNGDFDAVYGNAQIYKPTVAYDAVGSFTVTFPSSVVDARGNTQAINLAVGWANVDCNNDQGWVATCNRLSANVFKVYLWSIVDQALKDLDGGDTVTLFVM